MVASIGPTFISAIESVKRRLANGQTITDSELSGMVYQSTATTLNFSGFYQINRFASFIAAVTFCNHVTGFVVMII